MARPWFGYRRLLGDQHPAFGNCFLQIAILGRISHVDTACNNRNRSAIDRSDMCSSIYSSCQARDDRKTRLTQFKRQCPRKTASPGRSVSCTNYCHCRAIQELNLTPHSDNGRRIFKMGEKNRIVHIIHKNITRAQSLDLGHFAFYRLWLGKLYVFTAASMNEVRQGIQCLFCIAKTGDELSIGNRPDIRRTN